jgi:hypothetical protein
MKKSKGISFIGILFLLVGVFEFFSGDIWIVWIILGVMFGGLGIFGAARQRSDK